MKFLKRMFGKEEEELMKPSVKDDIDRNYICLVVDPINTVNDLRKGNWNRDKVYEGLARGILRYARKSEIEKAKELGILKEE